MNAGGDAAQQRQGALEPRLGASDHGRELAGSGDADAAAHRRIEKSYAGGLATRLERADEGMIVRTRLDEQKAGARARQYAVVPSDHSLDVGRAWEARHDRLDRARHFSRDRQCVGPRDGRHGSRIPVADRDIVAGGNEATRHPRAHATDADNADLHTGLSGYGSPWLRRLAAPPIP
jgi:hypothetical protein